MTDSVYHVVKVQGVGIGGRTPMCIVGFIASFQDLLTTRCVAALATHQSSQSSLLAPPRVSAAPPQRFPVAAKQLRVRTTLACSRAT
eukprot:2097876-Rhodomonas_salina.3